MHAAPFASHGISSSALARSSAGQVTAPGRPQRSGWSATDRPTTTSKAVVASSESTRRLAKSRWFSFTDKWKRRTHDPFGPHPRRDAIEAGVRHTNVRIVRWVAVPLVAIAGYYLSVWLFFQSAVSCLHLGPRPPGLCSDWWYASHSWIAVASCTLVGFAGSVLLPTMVAPRHKRI